MGVNGSARASAAFPGGVRLVKVFYAVGIHKVPMSDGAPPHPIPLGVLVGASELGQAGRPDLGFFLTTSATGPL